MMKFPALLALLLAASTATAQDLGDDLPSTIAALTRECPTQMARITPCIDTSADLTTCTECVSTFILNADFSGGAAEARQDSNATTSTATDTCSILQDTVCEGIDTCGDACGVVDSTSFFTFGSECEQLFLNLVTCVLDSQGIGGQCDVSTCAAEGEEGGSSGNRIMAATAVWMAMAATAFVA